LKGSLKVYADMMLGIKVKQDKMRKAAREGFTTATDLADYLVRKGIAFRDAHEIVGKAVRHCVDHYCYLDELPLETFKTFSKKIEEDVYQVLTLEGSVSARNHLGGTAPEQVKKAIEKAKQSLT